MYDDSQELSVVYSGDLSVVGRAKGGGLIARKIFICTKFGTHYRPVCYIFL